VCEAEPEFEFESESELELDGEAEGDSESGTLNPARRRGWTTLTLWRREVVPLAGSSCGCGCEGA
jgi:hypothetical protein